MWLVESYGPVVEVEAFPGEGLHARCDPSYREKVVAEMASYGNGIEAWCDVQAVAWGHGKPPATKGNGHTLTYARIGWSVPCANV